jgi:hypothetical protein
MTDTTRRALLGAAASVAALAPLAAALPADAAVSTGRLYRRRRFTPLRGRSFNLSGKAGSWRLTLTGVDDLSEGGAGDDHRFGLTFHCRAGGPPQGTYVLRRPGFTETTLFVVPSDADHRTYQAVINRRS